MKVNELESKGVIGVDVGETLKGAARYLSGDDIGALAVFRGETLVGILSERDIVRALADDEDLDKTEVKEYMTEAPVVVADNAHVGEAIARMNEFEVRHVIVMKGKEPAGMISIRDVLGMVSPDWPEL